MPGITQVNGHDHSPSPTKMAMQASQIAPIAVIGLGGRFPGDAISPRALWEMCCEGRSAWSEIPADRMSAEAYFHPNPSKSGCFNSRGAHFLKEDIGLFDAQFFNIPPNEAKSMDPQQRLLLECTYEAFENGGVTLESLMGSPTGVYVGASTVDYGPQVTKDADNIPIYHSTGTSNNILSNRISYVFDLKGPSFTIKHSSIRKAQPTENFKDTACSSSLVALHTACQSLRAGETSQAIVGGATIMLNPDNMVALSNLRLFGEDGRSYTYDSRGTGYGRGEGVVSVLLKPLDAAIRDGNNIQAIIRNTGVNQDGKTNGITFPSCEAQTELMKSVYKTAGLRPDETAYVEAHGTGTAAGDPIEAEAIFKTFVQDQDRPSDKPLIVGSVKTNIGHLEAASGLAALVKTIFALEQGLIPPNINFESPNENIPLKEWELKIPLAVERWPSSDVRRASISNFGFGGTNAHVILEHYSKSSSLAAAPYTNGVTHQAHELNGHFQAEKAHTEDENDLLVPRSLKSAETAEFPVLADNSKQKIVPTRRLFVLSAKDQNSLKLQMERLDSYLKLQDQGVGDIFLERLAMTLSQRRSMFDWREAMSASSLGELTRLLASKVIQPVRTTEKLNIGFVFTGQGAQWATMGSELFTYPVFAKSMQEADDDLRNFGASWSLLDELQKAAKTSEVNRPYVSQPATTAIQIALVRLLQSWKIKPMAVVGHSSGEIGAAYATGALSAQTCMLIAYERGLLAESLNAEKPERPGRMLAIGASPANVRPMLNRLGSAQVVIACVNGPSLVTTSGDERGISRLQSIVEDESLLNRKLKVDVAYHSPHMEDIAIRYLDAIKNTEPKSVFDVAFHSSVKGHRIETQDLGAAYWVANMTSPVEFVEGVQSMYNDSEKPDILIEIGPHSTLESSIRDIMKHNPQWSSSVQYLSTLSRGQDAIETMMALAGALFVMGCNLDFLALNLPTSPLPALLSDLPIYPWNHSKRHWHESRIGLNHRLRRFPRSDILGSLVDDYNDLEPRWRNVLRISDMPWLTDHKVQGSIIFPLAGYFAMAIEGAFQHAILHGVPITAATKYKLRRVRVSRSMVLTDDAPTETSIVFHGVKAGSSGESQTSNEFSVYSWRSEGGWSEHCRGLVSVIQTDLKPNPINGVRQVEVQRERNEQLIAKYDQVCQKVVQPDDIYARFSRGGFDYGPAFQNVTVAYAAKGYSIGTVTIPDTAKLMPHEFESIHIFHPATFDSFFQVIDFAATGGDLSRDDLHVPTFVKEVTVRHELPKAPGHKFDVRATAAPAYSAIDTDIRASFIVFDTDGTKVPLVEVEGFQVAQLPSQDGDEAQTDERGLCYTMAWEPCLDLLRPEDYLTIFPVSVTGQDAAADQIDIIERAAFYYIRTTMAELAPDEYDGFPPHLQSLCKVFTSLLDRARRKELAFQSPKWLEYEEVEMQSFLANVEASDDCGHLLGRMGRNLISIFREEVEPISLLKGDDMLDKYRRCHKLINLGNQVAASIVGTLAHQIPSMAIIEIGAGSGGATIPTLRALRDRLGRYDFTDISTVLFDNVKEECKDWAGKINYQKLNIEEDPIAQGFEEESYDVVIAANVLDTTTNIVNTMRNVRRLLKPGGKAIVNGFTAQLLSNISILGTLPDWWVGEEPERQDAPFLTERQWDNTFRLTGFSGVDGSVQVNQGTPSLASVLVTTAKAQQSPNIQSLSLILPQKSSEGSLVESLQSLLGDSLGHQIPVCQLSGADLDDGYAVVLALEDTTWLDLDESGLQDMQRFFQSARGILWVVRGASSQNPLANMITGLGRTLRTENAGLLFPTLDLDPNGSTSSTKTAEIIAGVVDLVFGAGQQRVSTDMEFREINGILHIPRVVEDKEKDKLIVTATNPPVPEPQQFMQPDRPLKMKLPQVGLLDSIYFEADHGIEGVLDEEIVELSVKATGMNFKDVMMSLGQIPFYHELGLECSGVVTAVGSNVTDYHVGDQVCGFAKGAYASKVRIHQSMLVKIPQHMTYTEAATIPMVFCTARYALVDAGRLSKGESVLIHAAAGGVGQAAIMLAQHLEADVYVTVSSVEKRSFLMETYGISEGHVFSSRDTTFATDLMALTHGRGVDVVLNSTAGEILHHSWQCLAPLGRLIEIGKRDIVQNSSLEMEKFADSVSFISVDLGVLLQAKPLLIKQSLLDVMDLYQRRIIQPVSPITVLPMSQIAQGMRIMQGGKHTGKVVIEAIDDDLVQAIPAPSKTSVASEDASYLITGGTGGIGRSITRWLVHQGAKHVILASRRGMGQKGISDFLQGLETSGCNITVKKCDIANRAEVENMIDDCTRTLPPIRGVIHSAMANRDAMFDNTTFEGWTLNIGPRVRGALNLHHCLAARPLDFFIMLGSAAGICGNPGQTAYSATNTFFDSFAAYRQSLGQPACTIDLGIVEGVGYVAENDDFRALLDSAAHERVTEEEILALVKIGMANCSSSDYQQIITGCKLLPDEPLPKFAIEPKFSHIVHNVQSVSHKQADKSTGTVSIKVSLQSADSNEAAMELVATALTQKLSSLLLLPVEEIPGEKPIVAYGLDSLVAVEFRNWITREMEANVPLMELMNSASIKQLARKICEKSRLVKKASGEDGLQVEKRT